MGHLKHQDRNAVHNERHAEPDLGTAGPPRDKVDPPPVSGKACQITIGRGFVKRRGRPPFASPTFAISVKRVLSHWSVSGILMAQSGAPFSLVSGGYVVEPNGTVNEISGLGTFTSQADSQQNSVFTSLTGGQIKRFFGIHENPNGTVSYVSAPAGAFQEPAPGTIGNLQKRLFTGPGAFNLNLGVRKMISLTEQSQAEFRAESINLLNRVNWLVGDQAYLGISNQAGAVFNNNVTQWNSPRTFQFSLRLLF